MMFYGDDSVSEKDVNNVLIFARTLKPHLLFRITFTHEKTNKQANGIAQRLEYVSVMY